MSENVTKESLELLTDATKQNAQGYAALAVALDALAKEVRYNHRMNIIILSTLLAGVLASTGYYRAVSLPDAVSAAIPAETVPAKVSP